VNLQYTISKVLKYANFYQAAVEASCFRMKPRRPSKRHSRSDRGDPGSPSRIASAMRISGDDSALYTSAASSDAGSGGPLLMWGAGLAER